MTQPTPNTTRQYTLDQLAELAGVNRRTVRYYIQLGLVDRPIGETRAAHYTWQHLQTAARGARLHGAGVLPRAHRRELMRGEDTPPAAAAHLARPAASPCTATFILANGVELVVEPGQAGLTPEQLRRFAREAIAAYARITREQD